jgi:hypothetical protein
MAETTLSISPLVAVLNDRSRTRIGNPSRGTNHISIAADQAHEAARLGEELDKLQVTYQTNYQRNERRQPIRALLTIYGLDDQRRLLEAFGQQLDPAREKVLRNLVAARGPIAPDMLKKLQKSLERGKNYEYLAARLNALDIIEGRGNAPWTAKKLRRKLREQASEATQAEREVLTAA